MKLEAEVKENLEKRKRYKDKAKKYKVLLRKRDKEIMDLAIESKELKGQLERDHKKSHDMKSKMKQELALVKDEMHSMVKRTQMDYNYEKDSW